MLMEHNCCSTTKMYEERVSMQKEEKMQENWKDVEAGSNHKNKYSTTEFQGRRAVIGVDLR